MDVPEAALPMPLLAATGVACRRGEHILFSDLDLAIAPGDVAWLRAANGFGKTTLLRVLAGLSRPEAGRVARRDDAVGARPLLYLAHANALKDDLTVLESIRHAARLQGIDASDATLTAALHRFALHVRRDAAVRTLSQGLRRRVALTRLCLWPPGTLWLLDEPYDALDQAATATLGTLLRDHAARGGGVLLTSHVAPDLAGLAPRVIQLDGGV